MGELGSLRHRYAESVRVGELGSSSTTTSWSCGGGSSTGGGGPSRLAKDRSALAKEVIGPMQRDWAGSTYCVANRNCLDFAMAVCEKLELGRPPILEGLVENSRYVPSWLGAVSVAVSRVPAGESASGATSGEFVYLPSGQRVRVGG